MLSVGIVGLPNVGKSTLFNALTRAEAAMANYPFTTIDSNVGVVPVPDPRLDRLAEALRPEEAIPSTVRFLDIAGLVEGASRGEGLGNRFLGEIRAVDAVAHVLRCFADPDVVHVLGEPDPKRDAQVIETELLLADLEVLERAIEKRKRVWQTKPQEHEAERGRFGRYREALEGGTPLRRLDLGPAERAETKTLGLITGREMLYVANCEEDEVEGDLADRLSRELGAPVVSLSARLEWELGQLEPDEREEMLAALGWRASGLERLAEAAFEALDLIRFYTIANDKLRAWEVPRGTLAPAAAGAIHSDMEEGFVRAMVARWDDVVGARGLAALTPEGKVRTEGKEYEVRDGDVLEIRF